MHFFPSEKINDIVHTKKLKYCVLDKEVQWIYVHHFSNCSWIHNGSFLKVMPGTKKTRKLYGKLTQILFY